MWALVAAMLISGPAMGDTAEIMALRQATREMSFLSYFFDGLVRSAPETEIADNYRAMNDATQTFLRLAVDPYPAEALRKAQEIYNRGKLPTPVSLSFVPVDAERRRDTKVTGWLCGALASVFSNATANMQADATFGPVVDNPTLYGGIRPPASGRDLLRSVQWAIDHRAFGRVDFYTRQNMQRFFDVDGLPSRTADGSRSTFYAKSRHEPACSYELQRDAGNGLLRITCQAAAPGMPTFDEVEAVFGKGWKSGRELFPRGLSPHDPGPPAARAKHGNEEMVYDTEPPALKQRVIVGFGPDAEFSRLYVKQEMR